jgi:hypothetical protein
MPSLFFTGDIFQRISKDSFLKTNMLKLYENFFEIFRSFSYIRNSSKWGYYIRIKIGNYRSRAHTIKY